MPTLVITVCANQVDPIENLEFVINQFKAAKKVIGTKIMTIINRINNMAGLFSNLSLCDRLSLSLYFIIIDFTTNRSKIIKITIA